jgi:pimeloyl-ACP methyl ester carboxylesterase
MPRAKNGAIEIEYECFGDPAKPALLIVNGFGVQMIWTPADFCEQLAARGYHVIRFDNRDVGLSSWPSEPYTLSDMARDGIAVLDAEGIAKAHIAGISMGGMIVQRMAIEHPDRILSMTSIMSFPGPDKLVSDPEASAMLTAVPPDPDSQFEDFVAHMIRRARMLESPGYRSDEAYHRDRVISAFRRAYNPPGLQRQMAAIGADGDRTEGLGRLRIPVMVLHGADDPLVHPSGGEATARAIPGAKLRIIIGMGHDMPPSLWKEIADAIEAVAGA